MRYHIIHHKDITSTNDYAIRLARKGSKEGTVIVAEHQSCGRGRFHRRWVSPHGKDLLFSILLRPPIPPHKSALLTRIATHSISDILKKRWRISNHIKLPNDVRVGKRKICGVLLETSFKKGHLDYAVVGIGLNVNSRKKELVRGATSIFEETGRAVRKSSLFKLFLKEFAVRYKKAIKELH